jgi:hypothetical protein
MLRKIKMKTSIREDLREIQRNLKKTIPKNNLRLTGEKRCGIKSERV